MGIRRVTPHRRGIPVLPRDMDGYGAGMEFRGNHLLEEPQAHERNSGARVVMETNDFGFRAIVPVLFKVMVFVEVSLASGGVGCGILGMLAGKPGGLIVTVASAVAAASGLALLAVAPRLWPGQAGAAVG